MKHLFGRRAALEADALRTQNHRQAQMIRDQARTIAALHNHLAGSRRGPLGETVRTPRLRSLTPSQLEETQ